MLDPGREIAQRLEELGLTQKALSLQIGKKVSEINELIKGKRKITLAWDYLLAGVFHTPQKYWIHKQIDMDYAKMLEERREQQENIPVNQPSISSQQPRSADQQGRMLSGQAFSQMGEEFSLLTQLEDGGQGQEQEMQQPVSPVEQNEQIEQFVSGVQQSNDGGVKELIFLTF